MANSLDKFRKGVARWSGNIGSAGISDAVVKTVPLASTSGLPTDTAVMITVNRVDTNGKKTGNYEGIVGVVSGSNLIDCIRGVEGTAQAWTGGTVVEVLHTASNINELIDGILAEHNQDGTHKDTLITSLKATGAEITTGTEDAKIVTPKAIADSTIAKAPATATENAAGTDNAKFITALANVPAFNSSLSRQAIINGNFDVWQRGTSVAMTAADAYTADRWYCETATAGTDKTVSREDGTGVNGSYYCARVKMVSDVDELLTFSQALESQDSIKFRGKKVTLSFYARGGAEFVADNATLVSKIVTGKGTDQKVLAFTTSADGVAQNNTLTTAWQKFTCTTTAVIAADITQIGVSFAFTHAGSGTTTNYFEVTQVQLCAGDVALPFMPKSFEEELRACMRYYEKSYNYDTALGTITVIGSHIQPQRAGAVLRAYIPFRIRKRAAATCVVYGTQTGATSGQVSTYDYATGSNLGNRTAISTTASSESGFLTGTGSAVASNDVIEVQWTADAEL